MGLSPNLILHNGNVITVNAPRPKCQAIAIWQGKIVALGSDAEILALAGSGSRKMDLQGKTVLPGFIDPHQHLLSYGITMKTWLDLAGTSWRDDICTRVGERVKAFSKGTWILGRGWNEEAGGGRSL